MRPENRFFFSQAEPWGSSTPIYNYRMSKTDERPFARGQGSFLSVPMELPGRGAVRQVTRYDSPFSTCGDNPLDIRVLVRCDENNVKIV